MIEKPYSGRARIINNGMQFKVIIAAKRNLGVIVFLFIWLIAWSFGEMFAYNTINKSDIVAVDVFLLVWITAWTLGGLFVFLVIIWSLLGREIIIVENGILTIQKGFLTLPIIKKKYDISLIKNMELSLTEDLNTFWTKNNNNPNKINLLAISGGKICFDYGLKTIRFASSIDNAEARSLLIEFRKIGYFKEPK
ncbi:MAG TPA: hypothetical protein PKZ21_02545 [Bacteroidales bacterium]|nr:hypothetical protein [Bacteroidales bacterium]